jgi:hypothetical protein
MQVTEANRVNPDGSIIYHRERITAHDGAGVSCFGLQDTQTASLWLPGSTPSATKTLFAAILIMTAAIGIQIGIGTEIDEKARISTPIAIAISTVQMCHN